MSRSLVGRRRELLELDSALAAIGRPRHLYLISGEPGIGKTTLALELARRASERSIRTLWGKCAEGGGAPAFWAWIQIVRTILAADPESIRPEAVPPELMQIVPELMAPAGRGVPTAHGDSEASRFRLFDAITNLLKRAARREAMLVIIDDIHDGDLASLELLRFVARESGDASMVMIGTYREAEVRRSPKLGKLIGELSRESFHLPLKGLSENEVTNLVANIAGRNFDADLMARLCAATSGNPLFVEGIARLMVADASAEESASRLGSFRIPDSVREAIRLRLAVLSVQTRLILEVSAVIGNDFDVSRCQRVAAVDSATIQKSFDEAAHADIVRARESRGFRFSHALIREVLYNDLDGTARIRMHRSVAEAIEQIHRDDIAAHLDELAHHFRHSEVHEKALEYSIRASDAAREALGYDLACAHLEDALASDASLAMSPTLKATILHKLGFLRFYFFDHAEGIEYMEAALRIRESIGNRSGALECRVRLGPCLFGADLAGRF